MHSSCSSGSEKVRSAPSGGYHQIQVEIPKKPENKSPRKGKTRSDRVSGSWQRHLSNMALRRDWNRKQQNDAKQGSTATIQYPTIGGSHGPSPVRQAHKIRTAVTEARSA